MGSAHNACMFKRTPHGMDAALVGELRSAHANGRYTPRPHAPPWHLPLLGAPPSNLGTASRGSCSSG